MPLFFCSMTILFFDPMHRHEVKIYDCIALIFMLRYALAGFKPGSAVAMPLHSDAAVESISVLCLLTG
jgi:hypothetical protein